MDSQLINLLRQEMSFYAGEGLNSITYLTENTVQNVFISTTMYKDSENTQPFTDLLVRIVGDTIIIEEDRNDKPLYQALVQAGIPRDNIVLAYAGEKYPAELT